MTLSRLRLLALLGFLLLLQTSLHAQPALELRQFTTVMGSWLPTPGQQPAGTGLDVEQRGRNPILILTCRQASTVRWQDTLSLSTDGTRLGQDSLTSLTQVDAQTVHAVFTSRPAQGDAGSVLRRTLLVLGPDTLLYSRRECQIAARDDEGLAPEERWTTLREFSSGTRGRILQPWQMRQDLAILRSVFENVHPGTYRYNSPAQLEEMWEDAQLRTATAMDQRQFWLLLAQVSNRLHCGHTFVSYYNNRRMLKANLYSRRVLPFLFSMVQGKMVITHDLSGKGLFPPGSEVLALDGIPAQRIIDSLLTVSKADGANGRPKQLDNISQHPADIQEGKYCLFDIYHPLFFTPDLHSPGLAVSLRTVKGRQKQVQAQRITHAERLEAYTRQYGSLPKNEQSWAVKPLDNATVLLRLGDFTTFNWKFDFHRWLDSVFTTFEDKGYQNLLVDIRHNEGGADDARDAVLAYLISKPIPCPNDVRRLYRYRTIPDSLKPHLDTWDPSFLDAKPEADFPRTPDGFYEDLKGREACASLQPQAHRFKGRIFLLTDVTNSSATFIMADAFKRNKLGTIVGETTGGSQQGINGGELFFLYLPHSRMEVDIPLIYQAPANPRPDEGIAPDHHVPTTAQHIAQGRDPQVEFIMKRLLR